MLYHCVVPDKDAQCYDFSIVMNQLLARLARSIIALSATMSE